MEKTTKTTHELSTLMQRMEKFFETYPPIKVEAMLWHWSFLCAERDFSTLSEQSVEEFTDFFKQLEELASASQEIHKDRLY